jgi:hypothetical protein
MNRNWEQATKHVQLTWKSETDKLETNTVQWLEHHYESLSLANFDLTDRHVTTANPAMLDFRFRASFQVGEIPVVRLVIARVIRETAPFKPNPDAGTWGVNPISFRSFDNR